MCSGVEYNRPMRPPVQPAVSHGDAGGGGGKVSRNWAEEEQAPADSGGGLWLWSRDSDDGVSDLFRGLCERREGSRVAEM